MKISCPFCGQHIEIEEAGRYQCPACNKVFEVEEETPASQVNTQVQQVATCPYCTAPVSTAARKCPHCGEWIGEKPKNRAVYLILAFLFGNLGIAEFYAGKVFMGSVILLININLIIWMDLPTATVITWIFAVLYSTTISTVGKE